MRILSTLGSRLKYDGAIPFPVIAAAIAVLVQVVWVASEFRRSSAEMAIVDWDPSVHMMHLRILVALVIIVGGLLWRRMIGLCLSFVAIVWLGLEYTTWFLWSARIKANAGLERFPQAIPDAFGLYGATPWNAVVLILVMAVFVWEIRQLSIFMKSQPVH